MACATRGHGTTAQAVDTGFRGRHAARDALYIKRNFAALPSCHAVAHAHHRPGSCPNTGRLRSSPSRKELLPVPHGELKLVPASTLQRRRWLQTSPRVRAATCIASASASASDVGAGTGAIHIRVAEPLDYWPAADLHCQAFNADVSSKDTCKALSLRVDRIVSLQINDRIARDGAGNSALLLAFDGEPPSTPEQLAEAEAAFRRAAEAAATRGSPTCTDFPHPMWWLGRPLAPGVRPGIGVSAQAVGLVGVAAVDSFGDLVPPRELNWRTDGQMGWYRREGYAYVSNVAVLPGARRRGVARQLMAEAEALAAEWGCRAVGLHCNPKKAAPWALYGSLGYRDSGVLEPAIMPYLQGRPPDRCAFLVKLVPGWGELRRQAQQLAAGADAARGPAPEGAGPQLAA